MKTPSMKANHTYPWLALLCLVLAFASGCSSRQPLSHYARAGETVVLSLGGTDSNAKVSVLKSQNVTVTITDAASVTHTAKLRNLFRVYSDPTSGYDFRSPTGNLYWDNYVTPHQGLWMAVVDLVDPSGSPLPLAAGSATISVSSPDLNQWVDYPGWGWPWTNGDLSSIPVEILAGTGTTNPMNYLTPLSAAPLDSLTASPQVEVTPAGTPSQAVGGGSFVFSYVNADFVSMYGSQTLPRVVATSPDPNIQLGWSRADQGDGTSLLRVVISNPHGFNTDNSKTGLPGGKSLFRSLRFSIVWDGKLNATDITDANWTDSIQLVSGEYIDLNGNVMPELSPVLAKVN